MPTEGDLPCRTWSDSAQDRRLAAQYLFEEICAKTLYNMSGRSAPFDSESPYWIVPNAFALARPLGVDDAVVLEIVAG